jgi:hypothetical protein
MTCASGFQIRKLVTPPLPNEFEIIKWTISRKSSVLSKIRAIVIQSLAGKSRPCGFCLGGGVFAPVDCGDFDQFCACACHFSPGALAFPLAW